MKWLVIALVVAAIALPVDAAAQTQGLGHRFEITGGGGLQTGADLGESERRSARQQHDPAALHPVRDTIAACRGRGSRMPASGSSFRRASR